MTFVSKWQYKKIRIYTFDNIYSIRVIDDNITFSLGKQIRKVLIAFESHISSCF